MNNLRQRLVLLALRMRWVGQVKGDDKYDSMNNVMTSLINYIHLQPRHITNYFPALANVSGSI